MESLAVASPRIGHPLGGGNHVGLRGFASVAAAARRNELLSSRLRRNRPTFASITKAAEARPVRGHTVWQYFPIL